MQRYKIGKRNARKLQSFYAHIHISDYLGQVQNSKWQFIKQKRFIKFGRMENMYYICSTKALIVFYTF